MVFRVVRWRRGDGRGSEQASRAERQRRGLDCSGALGAWELARSAERRAMERMTEARRGRAAALRECSGHAFLAAVEADRAALEDDYIVRVPWALLCRGANWEGPEHLDSTEYEDYRVTQCTSDPRKTSGAGQVCTP